MNRFYSIYFYLDEDGVIVYVLLIAVECILCLLTGIFVYFCIFDGYLGDRVPEDCIKMCYRVYIMC